MTVVLDTGALIALERADRVVALLLRQAQTTATPVVTSACVIGQVWRGGPGHAGLVRMLRGVEVRQFDRSVAEAVGLLLRDNGSSDVVDAHIGLLASTGDSVLTSDPDDLGRLLQSREVHASLVKV